MKKIKKILYLFVAFIMCLDPITLVAQSSNNENQIKNPGGSAENKADGIKVSKNIYPTELENYFDIVLNVETRTKAEYPDLAVVIVMDISNTMNQKMGDTTRLAAAQQAAEKFIDKFAEHSASGNNINRKIGFVAFNTDSHKIFELQECMTTTQAKTLKKTMNDTTDKIAKAPGYDKSHSRFTNIEAGLKQAKDMLNKSNASSKHIIFLSDGFPTTYIKGTSYKGYDPYTPNAKESVEGQFFDNIDGKACKLGTSYSDRAAIRAREKAEEVKKEGIKIYSIGVDIGGQTIQQYIDQTVGKNFSVVDRTSTTYEIGSATSTKAYEEWLKNKIGSGYYKPVTNKNAMIDAFTNIFQQIIILSEATWVTEDPMNFSNQPKIIDFVGIYGDNDELKDSVVKTTTYPNTATFIEDRIKWDLKNSNPTIRTENKVTYYNYEIKYRIRLKNEQNGFIPSNIYNTNGKTTLNYIVKENGKPRNGSIDFKIPQVEGYLGKLEFNKVSNYGNKPLAKFILVHDHDNCPCQKERKYMDKNYQLTSTSNEEGKVIFTNIPSGHKYKLKEVETDEYHNIDTTEYQVTVSYGNTSTNILNKQIVNNYKTKNLIIKKVIDGTISNQEFNFEIEATYQNAPLVGTYTIQRKLGRNININTENIEFIDGKATFKLKHNEEIKIIDLPYKINYKINEIDTDGFIVKYQVNGTQFDNNNLLVLKEDNTVVVTNISGYLLPATGSSSMLILGIIGVFLLGIPIVYITLNVLTKRLIIKH